MHTQEQFEALYADYTQTPIEQIVAARLGEDSYDLPKISSAWVWFRFGINSSSSFGHVFGTLEEMSLNQGEK